MQSEDGADTHMTRLDISNNDKLTPWDKKVIESASPSELLMCGGALLSESDPTQSNKRTVDLADASS